MMGSPKNKYEPTARFYSESKVSELTSLSRTSLWRLRRADEFPKPVQLTARRVAYRASDVDAWIRSKMGDVANDA